MGLLQAHPETYSTAESPDSALSESSTGVASIQFTPPWRALDDPALDDQVLDDEVKASPEGTTLVWPALVVIAL
jgi:hypothetical protein